MGQSHPITSHSGVASTTLSAGPLTSRVQDCVSCTPVPGLNGTDIPYCRHSTVGSTVSKRKARDAGTPALLTALHVIGLHNARLCIGQIRMPFVNSWYQLYVTGTGNRVVQNRLYESTFDWSPSTVDHISAPLPTGHWVRSTSAKSKGLDQTLVLAFRLSRS